MKTVDAGIRVKYENSWENCLIMLGAHKIDIFIPPKEASYWPTDQLDFEIMNKNEFEEKFDDKFILEESSSNENSKIKPYRNTLSVAAFSFDCQNCIVKRKLKNRIEMIKFGFNNRLLFEKYFDEFSKTVVTPKSRFSLLTCTSIPYDTIKTNKNDNCDIIIRPKQKRKKNKNSCGGFFGCF